MGKELTLEEMQLQHAEEQKLSEHQGTLIRLTLEAMKNRLDKDGAIKEQSYQGIGSNNHDHKLLWEEVRLVSESGQEELEIKRDDFFKDGVFVYTLKLVSDTELIGKYVVLSLSINEDNVNDLSDLDIGELAHGSYTNDDWFYKGDDVEKINERLREAIQKWKVAS